jgi:hypothetical protein
MALASQISVGYVNGALGCRQTIPDALQITLDTLQIPVRWLQDRTKELCKSGGEFVLRAVRDDGASREACPSAA